MTPRAARSTSSHCATGSRWPRIPRSLHVDRPERAAVVELRAPDLVRRLVLRHAERQAAADARIEVLDPLERVDQLLGVEVAPGLAEALDEQLSDDIALERHEVGILIRMILAEGLAVAQDAGGTGVVVRDDLG